MTKVKEGLKTSEFWLVIIAAVLEAVEEPLGLELPTEALYAVIAYVLGRSLVKYGAVKGPQGP